MVTRPGLPAMPISISRYRPADGRIELSIRAAGPATATLGRLAIGDELGLRGPLGQGWPVEAAAGRDVIVVAGGIGLSPLRPLIDELLAGRDRFGTRAPVPRGADAGRPAACPGSRGVGSPA